MRQISLILIIILLNSCAGSSENNSEVSKEYKYIEVCEDKALFGSGIELKEKNQETITDFSDSAAYLAAYEKFCIALKANQELIEMMGESSSTPKEFKLLNENGIDIAKTISFADKEKLEKEIKSDIFSLSGPNLENTTGAYEVAKTDPEKIKELEKYFNQDADEFDPNKKVWHKPKTAPKYANSNGIYLYFQSNNGIASNLRFKVQYCADDQLFFTRIQFSIDDKAFEYIPTDTETDSGNGGQIWEWFDQPVESWDIELLEALANAKSAKMKFIGKQYYDVKTISSAQIKDIQRTLELYKAMGGEY